MSDFDDQFQAPEPTQRCTGLWIPIELKSLGLNVIERNLLALIDSLDHGSPAYCFASNAYLAKEMEISESRISFYITKFKRMGLIIEVGYDGRRRKLQSLKSNWYKTIENDPDTYTKSTKTSKYSKLVTC